MNALGVQVEQARRRPIMSFFHAFFSVGNFVGRRRGAGAWPPCWDLRRRHRHPADDHAGRGRHRRTRRAPPRSPPRPRWSPTPSTAYGPRSRGWPGCSARWRWPSACPKGTAVDWSSLHVTDVAQVDPTTGSLGLIAVSGFMVVIRLARRPAGRPLRPARTSSVSAASCAAVGLRDRHRWSDSLPLLVVGWALVGFGVGMIAPQVYAVAGPSRRRPGAGRGRHLRLRGLSARSRRWSGSWSASSASSTPCSCRRCSARASLAWP